VFSLCIVTGWLEEVFILLLQYYYLFYEKLLYYIFVL
jgi:hypothetical protein